MYEGKNSCGLLSLYVYLFCALITSYISRLWVYNITGRVVYKPVYVGWCILWCINHWCGRGWDWTWYNWMTLHTDKWLCDCVMYEPLGNNLTGIFLLVFWVSVYVTLRGAHTHPLSSSVPLCIIVGYIL